MWETIEGHEPLKLHLRSDTIPYVPWCCSIGHFLCYFLTFSGIIFNCIATIKYKRQRVGLRWIPWYVTLVGCNGSSCRRNCYTLGGSSDNWRWIGLQYHTDDADGLFQLIVIPYAVIWRFPLLRSVVAFQTWWQGEITKYTAIGRPYFLEAGESPN